MKAVVLGLATSLLVVGVGCKRGSKTEESEGVPSTRAINLPPREPPASRLVVMLHGLGHDADSLLDVAHALQPALPHVEMVLPDGFHPFDGGRNGEDAGPGARQWLSVRGITEENRTARFREAGNEVSRWIDAELARRGLGGDRLVVVGISQGAMVSAWLAVHRNPRPAAVVILSGRVAWAEDPAPPGSAPAVPILIANGGADVANPVEPSATLLESWGMRVTKRVYPGAPHGVVNELVLTDVSDFLKTALGGS